MMILIGILLNNFINIALIKKLFNKANTISKLNIAQNSLNFELELIENQPFIFKKKLFSKTLDFSNSDPEKPENYRTVTIKCFYPSCK